MSSSDDILQRFEAKQGPIVLERTARSRWHSSNVWTSLLTIFFGIDGECTHVQSLEDFGQWLATGSLQPTSHTFCSFAWDAIAAMLAEGLHELQKGPAPSSDDTRSSATEAQDTFLYAVGLLSASQDHLPNFRHFLARSQGFTSLLHALHHGYARAADPRRHSGAEFPGHAPTESKGSNLGVKAPSFLVSRRQRRASEYVVLPSQDHQGHEGFDHARSLAPRATTASSLEILESRSFKAVAQILEMAAVEQVLHGKDFNGLGLFLKAPDLSPDSVAEVNSVILSRIIARVADVASTDTSIFHQSQSLINLGRFVDQCVEAIKEDWYQDKNLGLLRFLAAIIGRLDDREIRTLKNVRLCSQAVAQVRKAFVDLAMFELSLSLQKSSMHDYQDDPPTPSGASDAMYDPLTVLSQASVVALVVGDLDDRALGITQ